MAHIADNADEYAGQRLNIFFPGVIPELDGQCVSLAKWFMQDMSDVPNPQAARGDARYVGKTLVNQGHAFEVPYDKRIRGDLVCYEYGQYGHIGVILSDNRTFEENVNWPGVSSKIVDGARVYASRIGSMSEAWRHDAHIYRLKTYKEGDNMPTDGQIQDWISKQHYIGFGKPATDAVFADWGAVLRNNFVDGSLSILAGIDTNGGALKNQPTPEPGEYVPYTPPQTFVKKG